MSQNNPLVPREMRLPFILLVFMISRFAMTWLLGFVRASALLVAMALLGTVLCGYAMFDLTSKLRFADKPASA